MKKKESMIIAVFLVFGSVGLFIATYGYEGQTVRKCYEVEDRNLLLINGMNKVFIRNDTVKGDVQFKFDVVDNDTLDQKNDVLILTYKKGFFRQVNIEVKKDVEYILNEIECPAFMDGEIIERVI